MSTSVFIAGAAGYIGFGVALSFRRNGYRVYGLIRNSNQSQLLIQNEIIPVIASVTDIDQFSHILERCHIFIDAIGYGTTAQPFLQAVIDTAKKNKPSSFRPL